MRYFMRITALLIALAALICLAACGGNGEGNDPKATEAPAESAAPAQDEAVELTDAQRARAEELIGAFSLFGECDMTRGQELAGMERIIYCRFTTEQLEYSGVPGYGRLPKERADEFVKSVFKGIELADFRRTRRDPEKEQDFYYEDGFYYIKASGTRAAAPIESVKPLLNDDGSVIGVTVKADSVNENGEPISIELDLPYTETNEFAILRCRIFLNV